MKGKMVYYGISEGLIKRIVRFPKRKETGVAENTVAVMQSNSNKKKPQEVWVMYQPIGEKQIGKSQITNHKIQIGLEKKRIISAWRYPGVSPVGRSIPIPDDILQELENLVE